MLVGPQPGSRRATDWGPWDELAVPLAATERGISVPVITAG